MQVGYAKNAIPDEYLYGCIGHVRIGAYSIYCVTLIGVFLGHFCINLHQTRNQYSNEGPQHWNSAQFPKKRF